MSDNRNKQFYLILFVFIILFIVTILFIDSFFIYQSIMEICDVNKELHHKLENLEINQQEKIRNIMETVNKKLTEIANNENLTNPPIKDPTTTQWVFIGAAFVLCVYVMVSI